ILQLPGLRLARCRALQAHHRRRAGAALPRRRPATGGVTHRPPALPATSDSTRRPDGNSPRRARGDARVLIPAEAERRYIHDIFCALDTSEDEACAMAEVLVKADLRGHTSHGLQRVPLTIELLQSGHTQGNARPHIRQERAAAALLDADRALGPHAG